MIVRKPRDLPEFDKDEMLCVDVETTSFDDKTKALQPFKGHRICGVAVGTMDMKHSWYIPMRHSENPQENIPLNIAQRWLKDIVGSGRDILNQNIKFDAKFWHHDGAECKGQLIDLMILARLWKSDLPNLSLAYLTGKKEDTKVKAYLHAIKSKDYGRVPISILGPYAENDITITIEAYKKFMRGMRSEGNDILQTEIKLTKELLKAEIYGIKIDEHLIKVTYRDMLRSMLKLQEKIDKLAGCEVDCMSSPELYKVLTCKMGFEPLSYTDKGNAQWDAASLERLEHPIGSLIKEYSHLSHFTSTYCAGWLDRIGEDGRLHTDFRIPGARTGRLSSKNPNFQNIPAEAEIFVLPDEGYHIGGGDYSQIEYRLFVHYSNNAEMIERYSNNPDTDYHQEIADMIGVPRPFAKALNFSFIYGMGKKGILNAIAGLCAVNQEDMELREKLRTFGVGQAGTFAKRMEKLDLSEFKGIASRIYDEVHQKIPAIKQLQQRVINAINTRGWVRNLRGRIYEVAPRDAYKGINKIIQGSAADIFKLQLLKLLVEKPELKLITNVHDSVYFSIPIEGYIKHLQEMTQILEDYELRVPLRFTPTVSAKNWGTCIDIKKIQDTKEITAAIKRSKTLKGRLWQESA